MFQLKCLFEKQFKQAIQIRFGALDQLTSGHVVTQPLY